MESNFFLILKAQQLIATNAVVALLRGIRGARNLIPQQLDLVPEMGLVAELLPAIFNISVICWWGF